MNPYWLIILGLLLVGTAVFVYRRLPRELTRCPRCGYAQPPADWPTSQQQRQRNGRTSRTPLPTCPKCGFVYEEPKSGKPASGQRKRD